MMKTKFVLLLCLTALLAAGLVAKREYWSLEPYRSTAPYTNISRVANDVNQSLYTIADSKRTLYKADREGRLVYSISSIDGALPGTIQLFNSVAPDDKGNAYVLLTILDSFGLKVSGERIVKVSPDGKNQTLLYEETYDAGENLLRVGKIQSLDIKGDDLIFFRKEADSIVMLRLAAADPSKPEELRKFVLPSNRYVSELAGTDPERFYYTSKRGRLYAVGQSAEPAMVYPGEGTVQLNFPVQVFTRDGRNVYFIDYHSEAVRRVDAGGPGNPVESVLQLSQLRERYQEVEWTDFTSLYVGYGTIAVATADQIVSIEPDGKIAGWTDSYRFPANVIWLRYGYWLLIAAAAASFITTLRFAYLQLMKRRISLLVKQLGIIIPIILAAMVGLAYSAYGSFTNEMKDSMRTQLMLLAGNGKYLVDGERLERLNSPLDFMSDDYQAIKKRMNDLFSQAGDNRDGLYSTVYRYMDGKLYIVMDDDDSVTMFRPFLTSEENLAVLNEGRIMSGEWEDASGEWQYALGPLYNDAGEIVGIYETGKDMNGIRQNYREILYQVFEMIALIGGIILLVVTLMTAYLLSSIRTLRRSVNLVASGEWDIEVHIRTRDEVAELGERFNMMAGSIRRYIREVTGLSESYFRFVPQQFLNVLGKGNMTQVRLGDQVHRQMTVLVCGMRDFSGFSAKLTPDENFRFINSFLKEFGPVVRQYGGFTSRYTGPGMLALFPGHPGDALKAAVNMRTTLETYNKHRESSGYPAIEIGISIHYGDVMIGIIGEEQRMEGSVVSEQVNLASELEKTAAKLGASIVLTEEALKGCKGISRLEYRRLGAIQLYGEQRTIELYDVYEGDPLPVRKLKRETQQLFEEAVELYRNGRFFDAREAFVEVVRKNRHDLAAKLYFFASDHFYQQGVTADWNGALKIT